MTLALGLSATDQRFVEALAQEGDPLLAAQMVGLEHARAKELAVDPRVQAALLDYLQSMGPLDGVRARRVVRDLAERADTDTVRLKAAQLLWERGLGKMPETITHRHQIETISRNQLYGEIRTLIAELGLPPPTEIEGDFEEIPDEPAQASDRPTDDRGAGAQGQESPASPENLGAGGAGSGRAESSATQRVAQVGVTAPYVPDLPPNFR